MFDSPSEVQHQNSTLNKFPTTLLWRGWSAILRSSKFASSSTVTSCFACFVYLVLYANKPPCAHDFHIYYKYVYDTSQSFCIWPGLSHIPIFALPWRFGLRSFIEFTSVFRFKELLHINKMLLFLNEYGDPLPCKQSLLRSSKISREDRRRLCSQGRDPHV